MIPNLPNTPGVEVFKVEVGAKGARAKDERINMREVGCG